MGHSWGHDKSSDFGAAGRLCQMSFSMDPKSRADSNEDQRALASVVADWKREKERADRQPSGFECIFPCPETAHRYQRLFVVPRSTNTVLAQHVGSQSQPASSPYSGSPSRQEQQLRKQRNKGRARQGSQWASAEFQAYSADDGDSASGQSGVAAEPAVDGSGFASPPANQSPHDAHTGFPSAIPATSPSSSQLYPQVPSGMQHRRRHRDLRGSRQPIPRPTSNTDPGVCFGPRLSPYVT